MALSKITEQDLQGKGVIGLPDTPNLTTQGMQQKLDELVTDVVVPKHNALVDALRGETGAAQIGAAGGGTVQGELAALHTDKADAVDLRRTDTAVEALQRDKADAANVLTRDNAVAFSPTAPYHPATKKYIDDRQLEIGAGDMAKAVYDADNDGKVDMAADADKLGGELPAHYATQENISFLTEGVMEVVNEVVALQENKMSMYGGTFWGDVAAVDTNRSTACLRNSEVRITSVTGELQATNKIIFVRK